MTLQHLGSLNLFVGLAGRTCAQAKKNAILPIGGPGPVLRKYKSIEEIDSTLNYDLFQLLALHLCLPARIDLKA